MQHQRKAPFRLRSICIWASLICGWENTTKRSRTFRWEEKPTPSIPTCTHTIWEISIFYKHEGALQDYKIYLNLEPETLQRPSIIKLISLLESAAEEAAKAKAFAEAQRAAEEAERAAEEKLKKYKAEEAAKAKALAEAQKAAEEAERKAAEERYKKLMDEVNSSLLSVDEADALSVGAEGTLDYTEENELD